MNLKLVPLTLNIKIELAFKLQQFKKNGTGFHYTLKLELTVNLSSTGSKQGRVRLEGQGETPVFANARKGPH